jgi:hypothetical protein
VPNLTRWKIREYWCVLSLSKDKHFFCRHTNTMITETDPWDYSTGARWCFSRTVLLLIRIARRAKICWVVASNVSPIFFRGLETAGTIESIWNWGIRSAHSPNSALSISMKLWAQLKVSRLAKPDWWLGFRPSQGSLDFAVLGAKKTQSSHF